MNTQKVILKSVKTPIFRKELPIPAVLRNKLTSVLELSTAHASLLVTHVSVG